MPSLISQSDFLLTVISHNWSFWVRIARYKLRTDRYNLFVSLLYLTLYLWNSLKKSDLHDVISELIEKNCIAGCTFWNLRKGSKLQDVNQFRKKISQFWNYCISHNSEFIFQKNRFPCLVHGVFDFWYFWFPFKLFSLCYIRSHYTCLGNLLHSSFNFPSFQKHVIVLL